MRTMMISLLLASVASAPAMAAPRDDRAAAREERQAERDKAREERRESRKESSDSKSEAPRQVEKAPVQVDRPDIKKHDRQHAPAAVENREGRQRPVRHGGGEIAPVQERIQRPDVDVQRSQERSAARAQRNMFEQRSQQRDEARDERRAERIARQEALRNNARPPVVSPTPRPGTQPPPPPPSARPSHAPAIQWSSNHWRKDKRYDWYKYRNRYWWLFQLGFYHDPFGWGYQPYQAGWRMWPSYYSSNYWINDPWYYRLPYAPPGTRWIRYWDDAILVDTWSGQVVDVIYNFFW